MYPNFQPPPMYPVSVGVHGMSLHHSSPPPSSPGVAPLYSGPRTPPLAPAITPPHGPIVVVHSSMRPHLNVSPSALTLPPSRGAVPPPPPLFQGASSLLQPYPLFTYAGPDMQNRSRGTTPSGDSEGSKINTRALTQQKKQRRRQQHHSPTKSSHNNNPVAPIGLAIPNAEPRGVMPRISAPRVTVGIPVQHQVAQVHAPPNSTPSPFRRPNAERTPERTPPPSPPPAAISCPAPPADIKELDDHRVSQRVKQINFGKVTTGYRHYRKAVPFWKRQLNNPKHPETPDVRQACSKRKWDQEVASWRRALHLWDDDPNPSHMADPDALAYAPHQEMDIAVYYALTDCELENVHRDVQQMHGGTAQPQGDPFSSSAEATRREDGVGGGGFWSATAGETEVSTDEHSANETTRATIDITSITVTTAMMSTTTTNARVVGKLSEVDIERDRSPHHWEFGCVPFDQPSVHSSGSRRRSAGATLPSPIRPVVPAAGTNSGGKATSVTSISEARDNEDPQGLRVRIPINFWNNGHVQPFVLVMDSGEDPQPIFDKLHSTFQLNQLFVDGMDASNVYPAPVATVEDVARLLQQGKRRNMVLSLPKLIYKGELINNQSHFFEQIDEIRREMATPTTAREILVTGAPTTPDRLTFTLASGQALSQVFTPNMSAVKVNTTPYSFCFQAQGGVPYPGMGTGDPHEMSP